MYSFSHSSRFTDTHFFYPSFHRYLPLAPFSFYYNLKTSSFCDVINDDVLFGFASSPFKIELTTVYSDILNDDTYVCIYERGNKPYPLSPRGSITWAASVTYGQMESRHPVVNVEWLHPAPYLTICSCTALSVKISCTLPNIGNSSFFLTVKLVAEVFYQICYQVLAITLGVA